MIMMLPFMLLSRRHIERKVRRCARTTMKRRRHPPTRRLSKRRCRLRGIRRWRARRPIQQPRISLRNRKHQILLSPHTPHLVLALLHIPFRVVVHVQPRKREEDAASLEGMDGLAEPDDGDADNGDSLDEGCNGVSDGGRG